MKEWIKKNIWNVLGVFFGVAGLLSAYITYVAAEKNPNFTIINRSAHLKIVSGEFSQKGPLKLIHQNGSEIKHNVYVGTLTLWNSGDISLRESSVIKPLSITLPDGAEILDVSVIKSDRQDITGFTAKQTARGFDYEWKILEPNDGATVQIMYAADAPVIFLTNGAIEGVGSFNEGRKSPFISLYAASKVIFGLFTIVAGIFLIAAPFALMGYIGDKIKKPFPRFYKFAEKIIASIAYEAYKSAKVAATMEIPEKLK